MLDVVQTFLCYLPVQCVHISTCALNNNVNTFTEFALSLCYRLFIRPSLGSDADSNRIGW